MVKGVSVGLSRVAGMFGKLFASLRVGREHAELLSLVTAICLAIFATKTALAFTHLANPDLPPRLYDGRPLPGLGRVAACCAEDIAVALGCLLLGAVALRCWPRLVR